MHAASLSLVMTTLQISNSVPENLVHTVFRCILVRPKLGSEVHVLYMIICKDVHLNCQGRRY